MLFECKIPGKTTWFLWSFLKCCVIDRPEVRKLLLFYFFFFSTWSWKIIPYLLFIPYLRFHFFSTSSCKVIPYFDGLVQDCSKSSELAIELLQPCTKPSIYFFRLLFRIYFLAFLYLGLENYSILILLLALSVSLPEPINQPPTS